MTEVYSHNSANDKISVTRHDILVDDEYVTDRFDDVNNDVRRLADMGTDYYAQNDLDIDRKRLSQIDKLNNPATRELTEMLPSVSAWLDTIPTAAALHPLYVPDTTSLPNGTILDSEINEWFRNIADARGIRSRAKIMKDVLKSQAEQDIDQPQQWLSLASGAAQPVFEILADLRSERIPIPTVTLADKDKTALALAREYAKRNGLSDQITTKNTNILKRESLAYERRDGYTGIASSALASMRGRFEKESFDAVDAVGIFEYLKRPDWKYTYNGVISSSKELAGAETFLRNAYELVKPGGILILGNMLDTHPQIEFTLNVIQWPHIQPRSVDEMIHIMNTVGIEGKLDVYSPNDGVYAIYGIRKPSS